MWHFVICDDEAPARKEVHDRVRAILDKQQIQTDLYEITEYSSLAQLKSRTTPPSLVFLDVAFANEERGTQFGAEMRHRWPQTPVIYISSISDYVWDSFRAYLVSYVRKELLDEDLENAVLQGLDEIRQFSDPTKELPFLLMGKEGKSWVPIMDIYYVRSYKHRMEMYMKETLRYPQSPQGYYAKFEEEKKRLEPYHFRPVMRGMLINCRNIEKIYIEKPPRKKRAKKEAVEEEPPEKKMGKKPQATGVIKLKNGEKLMLTMEIYKRFSAIYYAWRDEYRWTLSSH